MTTNAAGVSARLAQFVSETRWEDIPTPVRHEAKRSLMNFFACALAGCRDSAIEAASSALKPFTGRDAATVIGRGERSDLLTAAFLNAASANVFDFDDTHTRTIIHPTAPVAAPVFAMAESARTSGAQALLAFILGVEVECRVGNAASPGHYRHGWHITSTCGVFGAAAAAAKLLGLPAERMTWTLGHASAQSGGLLETLGTMGKSISVGNAARNGLAAAFYAKAGVFGPVEPLEGAYGFLRVFGPQPDVGRVTEGLGEHWEISSNSYKPYPCGIVLNPVIEACIALAKEERQGRGRQDETRQGAKEEEKGKLVAADVQSVEITGHPLLRERTDRVHPRTSREAQVSAQHAVAVALTRGRAGLDEFGEAATADPELRALRERVSFVDDASYAVEAAAIAVRVRGGATLSRRIEEARGSVMRPLTNGDLEQKLRDLARYGRSTCDPARLIDAVWSLDASEDAGAVMSLAA